MVSARAFPVRDAVANWALEIVAVRPIKGIRREWRLRAILDRSWMRAGPDGVTRSRNALNSLDFRRSHELWVSPM